MEAHGESPVSVAVLLKPIWAELAHLERVVGGEIRFTPPCLEERLALVCAQLRALNREIGQYDRSDEPQGQAVPAVRDRRGIALKAAVKAYRSTFEDNLVMEAPDLSGPHRDQWQDGHAPPDCPEQEWKN